MNLREEVLKIKKSGYSDENAEALLCQDIILSALSKSTLNRNVTIKGGVVMRNLSKNSRRATQDLDLDFIKYSISDESINTFISRINCLNNISISISRPIQELNHQDYNGKRIFVDICDNSGNKIEGKIDIGVHKDLDIEQEEYCFDICFKEESVSLLINSKEQVITEKLKSLLRFMSRNTRYKDVFDIYYLKEHADKRKLISCIQRYIFDDETLAVNNMSDIVKRLKTIFNNTLYIERLINSNKNWLDINTEDVLASNVLFFENIANQENTFLAQSKNPV
ncbi:MAG: nucleotidyl transferase AbiEii/AbiGii toxin family protein [Erysipelotrichaceae bacterium]